eukprot:584249-Rhodomonas_salina.1
MATCILAVDEGCLGTLQTSDCQVTGHGQVTAPRVLPRPEINLLVDAGLHRTCPVVSWPDYDSCT